MVRKKQKSAREKRESQKRQKERAEQRKRDLEALDLGGKMRKRRKELGLTLEDLAERTDRSPNYLGSVERGTVDPSKSMVETIARGLDLAPGALVGELPTLSDRAVELGKLFDRVLNDEEKIVFIAFLRLVV